jgi:selenide,water dikinase
MSESVQLTQFSKGSGCGCKIAPAVLQQMLEGVRSTHYFPSLLVGNERSDDAAVIELPGGMCLISTVDFFTPVVDDARTFGKIAATNALSDVYAMGGTPVAAIAVLGWPVEKLPPALAGEVLQGAREVCDSVGIPLAGGHSIEAPEPFFGLSVNGVVQKEHIRRNTGVKEGDLLFLTKPIGSGLISAARKRGVATSEMREDAERWMSTLNTPGAVFGTLPGVHAMTDITGFGLLGHLREMLGDGNCSAELVTRKIPLMKGVEQLIAQMVYPDMTMKTYTALAPLISPLDAYKLLLGCDPQTSGGLLVAVDPASADEFKASARALHLPDFVIEPIGCIIAPSNHLISMV